MSFKNFIYYCALCGGWAAFLAWGLTEMMDLYSNRHSAIVRTALIATVLGILLASTIGMLDALLNAVGFQRFVRTSVCLVVGLFGGMLGGAFGQILYGMSEQPFFRVGGWAIVGVAIGASIGAFDLARAISSKQPIGMARRKITNGVIGGAVGGVLGGVGFEFLYAAYGLFGLSDRLGTMHSPRAIGLVILGICIGLMIGTAQVVLKEAWVKVEAGFRAGREMLLSKAETTIGRAESCDIGMFGDNAIEKLHAKIVLKAGRYVLVDNGTPGGTYLNGEQISEPTPLRNGDLIGVGKSALRFGERAKRN